MGEDTPATSLGHHLVLPGLCFPTRTSLRWWPGRGPVRVAHLPSSPGQGQLALLDRANSVTRTWHLRYSSSRQSTLTSRRVQPNPGCNFRRFGCDSTLIGRSRRTVARRTALFLPRYRAPLLPDLIIASSC